MTIMKVLAVLTPTDQVCSVPSI